MRIPAIPEIVTRSRNSTFLPGNPPNDPADRITIATARAGGMAVVTRDLKILDYAAGGVEPLGC